MVSLSGLSATYPGYLSAESTYEQNRLRRSAADEAAMDQLGAQAFGRTLMQLGGAGQQPGMPPGGAPPNTVPPGMPSQPMQRPPPMAVQGQPGQQVPMPMQRPGMPSQGGPSGMQPQMQGQPQGGGSPFGGGSFDWKAIAQKVVQANPGVPPAAIAKAVDRFIPLMNAESQQEWRQLRLMMQQQMLQERGREFDTRSGIQREAETGRKERFEQSEQRRTEQFKQREERLRDSAQFRNDATMQRLQLQEQALRQRAQQSKDRNDIVRWRAAVDAQHKRAMEIIQSNALGSNLKPADKKKLLDEEDQFYRQKIDEMKQMADPKKQNLGEVTGVEVEDQSQGKANFNQRFAPTGVKKYNPQTGTIE
jgi:hypothetical protein